MTRISDQFPVDLRTSASSLSICVFFCVTQFLLRGRNGNDNQNLQMISVRMNSLFSPIESGFRNRGDVPTITAGITANYGNDSLFLRCLPFQWKWFWMLLSNQILRQVLRLSHPFSSIRWVFDPGINIEYLKYWICIGQTKELWAYPFMELKNYERNTITNKEFVGSIHGLTLEGYGHWYLIQSQTLLEGLGYGSIGI